MPTHPTLHFTDLDVTTGSIDSNGGLTLHLPREQQVTLRLRGLRCVDLLFCPELERVDLGHLEGEVHVTVRGCPKLRQLVLPAQGGAHVHVDAGDGAPASLTVEGAVEQFDACWGRSGRFMRRVPRREPAWCGVHFHSGPIASTPGPAATPVAELVVLAGVSARDEGRSLVIGPELPVARTVCVVDALPALAVLEWRGGALDEWVVQGAPGLMVMRMGASAQHVDIAGCPSLRVLTTEGAHCGDITLHGCSASAQHPRNRARLAPGLPRHRAFLVVDAPCERLTLVDCGFERLKVFHPCALALLRCAGLVSARVEAGTRLTCEGPVPHSLLDAVGPDCAEVRVDEGTLARVRDEVLAAEPRGWQRLHRALGWCRDGRTRVAALQALAAVAPHVEPRELWEARLHLYQAEPGRDGEGSPSRWLWDVPADLVCDAYRHDFGVWAACRATGEASGYARVMADELLRRQSAAAREAMLPWLCQRPQPARLAFLDKVFRRACLHPCLPQEFLESLSACLPALIKRFADGPPRARSAGARLYGSARTLFTHHALADDRVAWLALEARHDRVATQARVAVLLRERADSSSPPLGPQQLAAMRVLMLTGRLPGGTAPHPTSPDPV